MLSVGRKRVWLLVALVTLVLSAAAYAAHDEIPRISLEETKKLVDSKASVIILDTQLKEIYAKGHIPGAISFPWKMEITSADVRNLPKDKLIITYCDCGPGESDSADVAAQLMDLGFSQVKILADPSIRGWIKSGYPVEK